MPASPAKRIFLSYTRPDRAASIEVFRDLDSLIPGQFWPEHLEQALRETDVFVVCLSWFYRLGKLAEV